MLLIDPKKTKYHYWSEKLLNSSVYKPCLPPSPKPPLIARPRKLSVTSIEMWMRDPYALYAKKILKLAPFDDIDYQIGPREKGILIHRSLELFFQNKIDPNNINSLRKLIDIGENVFSPYINIPIVKGFWWPRFKRIAKWFIDQQKQLKNITTLSEVWGEYELKTNSGNFTIFAKADRIDIKDNNISIIDYKTGVPSSSLEVKLGYACQLPLESVIAENGGFESLNSKKCDELVFWKLSGGHPAGQKIYIKEDVKELSKDAINGVKHLVESFDNIETPYRSFPRNKYSLKYNDYKHLARVDEWNFYFKDISI